MGVTGLWTVVAPTARPTQLASLNRKRLAVDASIWIYQFLKAVRDKEGNALRNSHVVGFFRRICKLLYFGIKPVFVFDGGAPILKRETIRKRARRREGRREDAARTAGKLLAVQVARAAEEEEKRRRTERERPPVEDELPADQELVYVEELGMTQKERQAGRQFKRKDQYHLPDLDVSIESLGAPNDPRIMSQAELEEYARQFHSGEDINLYDFSKIDFESPFFLSLPAGDRYNILNAARLRSRLRMGYSKEQLDGMFPDRMAFSKFQIERVKERNELTQRLMHLNGMAEDFLNQGGRIAGEKGKEYILVKNDGVDGGWALGVVSDKRGRKKEDAIDLDEDEKSEDFTADSADDEDFEDVAIEGLNRIPKLWPKKRKASNHDTAYEDAVEEIARKRRAVYEARRAATKVPEPPRAVPQATATATTEAAKEDSLFVPEDKVADDDEDDLFEDVLPTDLAQDEEDDELQRAIAMSLEKPVADVGGGFVDAERRQQPDDGSDEDDGFDLQAALAESRRSKLKPKTNVRASSPIQHRQASTPKFDGPLPFESINLGQSLLGKKKSKKIEEDLSGGFDRELGEDAFRKERPPQPMPEWFNAAPSTRDLKYTTTEQVNDGDQLLSDRRAFLSGREVFQRRDSKEIIDLDAEDEEMDKHDVTAPDERPPPDGEVHDLSPSSPGTDTQATLPSQLEEELLADEAEDPEKRKRDEEREKRYELARQIATENESQEPTSGEVAEIGRAEQPRPPNALRQISEPLQTHHDVDEQVKSDFEEVEWSESEPEQPATPGSLGTTGANAADGEAAVREAAVREAATTAGYDQDEGEDFEDVDMEPAGVQAPDQDYDASATVSNPAQAERSLFQEDSLLADSQAQVVPQPEEDLDYLSSSEEEMMRQLTLEAEEHARFTAALNHQKNPSTQQAMRDFEGELKALRSQQKRDRRDADEVTSTMVQECQALLALFGLPYITAPMEAEAQCAELVHLGLVDGIVTDDSDIFLFGGTRVYKNMFNAAKYVECYLASDLDKEFSLDRGKLIRFAHLLGSDYTEGLQGIGPVTALEIISDFSDLDEFRGWCEKIQLGRPQDVEGLLTSSFRRKFRKTAQKKIFLPTGFPDPRVDQAYVDPEVNSDAEPFQWGVPDLDKLRAFLMSTIGWSQERTDEVLVPVIRDMNRREVEGTQSNITRFFQGGVGVGAAAGRGINGNPGSGLAMGGEHAGGPGPEGMAPRNRTGKESGRMKNAFKRLRGEAERRRRRGEEAGDNDDDDIQIRDDVMQGVDEGDQAHDAPAPGAGPSTAMSVGDDDNDNNDDDGSLAGDESAERTRKTKPKTTKPKSATRKGKGRAKGRKKSSVEE